MTKSVFGIARIALPVLSLFSFLAHGQQPIPCKYFPVIENTSVEPGGGLVSFEIRADPAQFEPGKQVEYTRQCELALETPAPWLTVVDRTPLDAQGYTTVTLRAESNNIPAARTATLTVGTSRTVYPGALPHPANTVVMIGQGALPAAASPITVTNDASFDNFISAGTLVALFGNGNVLATTTVAGFSLPLPTSSNGTSVTMNGIFCPLIYVSPTQINLQAPMELQPGIATVIVNNNGQTFSTTVPVFSASPGIFTTDYYANGGVGILEDSRTGAYLTASNPAVPGQNVTVYFTGIGPITNNPGTGRAAPGNPLSQSTAPVTVAVNGDSVQPSFTGLTPGFAGLGQVNFQLPTNIPSGSIPLILTINGVSSKTVHISVTGGSTPTPPVPSISFFGFSPSTISPGQTTTLSWSTSNSTSVSIDHGIGTQPASGQANLGGSSSYAVPTANTTYTLTANNCINGTCAQSTAQATLIVSAPAGPTINSFTVSPSTINAGQSATLSWSVSNAATVSINNGIGSVALSGSRSVAPNSTTTYTITAITSAGASVSSSATLTVSAPPAQNVTLVFTNNLINDATISVNGTAVGTVSASQTQQVVLSSQPTMNVTFDVVPTRTSSGTAIGDPISGFFNPLSSPTGTVNFTISNYFANTNTYYFAPLVTNTSGTPLAMVVNYGLQAQNKCNCVVQSGAGATKIGYYLYYSNSNVAAFADGTNYTGMYRIFNGLGSFVQANSGVTNLTVSVFP